MFRRALIKMTLFYLLILMTISIFFSLALYSISTQEIQRSLGKQQKAFERVGPFMHDFLQDPTIQAQRDIDLHTANQRMIWQLVYTNLVILVVGGGLSYVLALITIKPIEEAHEAQVRFTGDASHELRSPLASMKAEIEVALRDKKLTKEEAVEILKSNLEEVEKLSSLSGYLLDLAKDEGAGFKLEHVKLAEIVKAAIGSMEKKATEKNITIETKIDPGLLVLANADSLRELLTILLDNAYKYSESGKKVEIFAGKVGRFVEVNVKDEGLGIKEADLPYVFDRLFRADQSRCKNKVEGYGLGLALAKKIAEANHAEIAVKSKLGEGSTFTVKLNR